MKNRRKGFTLAELLIAVAVVAIIVAISIPLFAGRAEAGKEKVCKNERQTMRNATVVASLTEHKDWSEYTEDQSQEIITYLLTNKLIDELFFCQSGGTIYASAIASDGVYFQCTYHDDGIRPEVPGDDNLNNAADNLKGSIEDFIRLHPELTTNDSILHEYVKSEDNTEFFKKIDVSTLLSKSLINKLVDRMISIPELKFSEKKNKAAIVASINELIKQQNYIVPYVAVSATKGSKIISYTTSKVGRDSLKAGTNSHSTTNLICYEGRWYFYANSNWDGSGVNPIAALAAFTHSVDVQADIDNNIMLIALDSL